LWAPFILFSLLGFGFFVAYFFIVGSFLWRYTHGEVADEVYWVVVAAWASLAVAVATLTVGLTVILRVLRLTNEERQQSERQHRQSLVAQRTLRKLIAARRIRP
jgi:hypothetical protein